MHRVPLINKIYATLRQIAELLPRSVADRLVRPRRDGRVPVAGDVGSRVRDLLRGRRGGAQDPERNCAAFFHPERGGPAPASCSSCRRESDLPRHDARTGDEDDRVRRRTRAAGAPLALSFSPPRGAARSRASRDGPSSGRGLSRRARAPVRSAGARSRRGPRARRTDKTPAARRASIEECDVETLDGEARLEEQGVEQRKVDRVDVVRVEVAGREVPAGPPPDELVGSREKEVEARVEARHVRRRKDQETSRGQHATDLGDHRNLGGKVLGDLAEDDEVERRVVIGERPHQVDVGIDRHAGGQRGRIGELVVVGAKVRSADRAAVAGERRGDFSAPGRGRARAGADSPEGGAPRAGPRW